MSPGNDRNVQRSSRVWSSIMNDTTSFLTARRRPKPIVMVGILLFHLLVFYGLLRAFAPSVTAPVENSVIAAFTVTVTAPDDPPEPDPEPDEGAAGDAGKQAVPKPQTAPTPKVQVKQDAPVPRASSTGSATTSGARDAGDGTGASGDGLGTGSGNSGGGQGGGIAVKPSVRSGELNQARDFPVPPGGRESRFGKSVTVVFTVGADGVARNCSVANSGVDPQTTAAVCPLVMQKIRFNPARDRNGNPVEARYGYRVDFKRL